MYVNLSDRVIDYNSAACHGTNLFTNSVIVLRLERVIS